MANLKDIATTLALMGTGAFVLTGCDKDKPATEVPSADSPTGIDDAGGEGSCAAADHPAEGHCGDDAAAGGEEAAPAEGSCGAEGDGSCGAEGDGSCGAEGEGSCGGEGDGEPEA